MTHDPCARLRGLLPLFVGDDLGVAQMQEVRRHLCECTGCRREAADLQQAHRALRSVAVGAAATDEAAFAAMHVAIMARVAAVAQPEFAAAPVGRSLRRVLLVAAAVLLGALGFWLAGRGGGPSVWDRPPTAVAPSELRAVPYAGPRLQLRPVGFDREAGGSAENGVGPGMMGRGQLRTLVDDALLLPPQRRD